MRRFLILLSACALSCTLAACGGGDSDNTLQTGIGGGGGNTRNSTPPGTTPAPTPPLQDIAGTGMNARQQAFVSEVFRILNEYRVANGRTQLIWGADITAVAQGHTSYQQSIGQLTHAGPPPCTVAAVCLADRLAPTGAFLLAGENVAHGQLTADQVMQAWIASPPHNDNLLDARWTHIGVGFLEGVSPVNPAATGPWWTQVFVQR